MHLQRVIQILANTENRFYANTGTPPQTFHVLPSLVSQTLYLPISDVAPALSMLPNAHVPTTAVFYVGGVEVFSSRPSLGFQNSESSTWSQMGT